MTPRSSSTIDRLSRRAFLIAGLSSLYAMPVGCAIFNRPKELDPSVYDRAVTQTTSDAVKEITRLSELDDGKKPTVCFIGVKGEGAESVSNAAREALNEERGFETLDKEVVRVALKEAGIHANDIFIPTKREKFVDALGRPVDYILAGYIEQVEEHVDPDDEDSKTIPKTVFRLQLVNLDTNRTSDFIADL